MSQGNGSPQEVISYVNNQINDVLTAINEYIAEGKATVNAGGIAAGANFMQFVRNARLNTLTRYSNIKTQLANLILNAIIIRTKMEDIDQLKKYSASVNEIESQKKKAADEIERIVESQNSEAYVKFTQYGEAEEQFIRTINSKHNSQRRIRQLFGLLVTLSCAATDFFMLYTMFLLGNLGEATSILSAVIFAIALDVPPYVLGWTIAKFGDDESLMELKKEDSISIERQKKKHKNMIRLMIVIIIPFFLLYLFSRTLLFLGNGDFSEAFSSIFTGTFTFSQRTFNVADLLSSLVPLATSVISYVMGSIFYSSYVNFIENTNILIDKMLVARVGDKNDEITDCIKQLKIIEKESERLKDEIWAFYMGDAPLPKDENKFFISIAGTYNKLNLSLYLQAYRACAKSILTSAKMSLVTVSNNFAPFAIEQKIIFEMKIDKDEDNWLNTFWVEDIDDAGKKVSDANQSANDDSLFQQEINRQLLVTQNDICLIQNKIKEIEKTFPDIPVK